MCGLLVSWWTWFVEDICVSYYCLGGHGLLWTLIFILCGSVFVCEGGGGEVGI